jgi:hypothetical protein
VYVVECVCGVVGVCVSVGECTCMLGGCTCVGASVSAFSCAVSACKQKDACGCAGDEYARVFAVCSFTEGVIRLCDAKNACSRSGQSRLERGSQVACSIVNPFHSTRNSSSPSWSNRMS